VNPWIKVIAALIIAAAGFAVGHHLAAEAGETALAKNQSAWDAERAKLASDRADAITAQQAAEQKQAQAISQAAANYEKGKADAEASNAAVVAGLRNGTLRLRDQWATCQASSAAVSSAASGRQPDGSSDDREASAGRIVRAAAQCDAQVVGLQQALMGERQ
jgi:hypothetical protein